MKVRLAEPDDATAVARLIAGFRDYYGEQLPADATIRSVVERLLDDPGTDVLLAGEPPCGVAQLRFRLSVWTGTEDAWLEDLFVETGRQGEGIGRALVEGCLARAGERGCARVQLDVNERNESALALYRSLGFESGSPHRWDGARDLYLTRWL